MPTARQADLLATRDFEKLAKQLREAADVKLQRKVSAAIRKVAKPVGQEVLAAGAAQMPHRGGLAALIAESKVSVSAWFKDQDPHVEIRLRNKVKLRALNSGLLRHPVFARSDQERKEWTWVSQKVPAQAFSRPLRALVPQVRGAAVQAAQDVLNDVARKV